MEEDEHHKKLGSTHPCSVCGSDNTWMVDIFETGQKEPYDSATYCDDCKETAI